MGTITVIDLWPKFIICHLCGVEALHGWGVPVSSETGEVVPNDYAGEWGAVPVCEECWRQHDSPAAGAEQGDSR